MSVLFHPCPACARHVKEGERNCPFCRGLCGEHARTPATKAVGATKGRATRASRAVLFAASAAGVAFSTTGCGSSDAAPPAAPLDGGPAITVDAGPDAATDAGDGPAFTHEGGVGEATSDAGAAPEGGADSAPTPNEGGPDGGADADAGGRRSIPIYGGPMPPIDAPEPPGGRSEPVDRPARDVGVVVRRRPPRGRARR